MKSGDEAIGNKWTRLSGVSPHEKSSPVLGELPEGVRGFIHPGLKILILNTIGLQIRLNWKNGKKYRQMK